MENLWIPFGNHIEFITIYMSFVVFYVFLVVFCNVYPTIVESHAHISEIIKKDQSLCLFLWRPFLISTVYARRIVLTVIYHVYVYLYCTDKHCILRFHIFGNILNLFALTLILDRKSSTILFCVYLWLYTLLTYFVASFLQMILKI